MTVSRRRLLRGAAVAGLGVPALAACAGEAASPGTPLAGGGRSLATSDVPVGGGTILEDELIVVTQPAEGEFRAFSAVCSHQGCPVQQVTDGRIVCNCHGSAFSIEDGSVLDGPAQTGLPAKSVEVDGDSVQVS